MRLRHEPRPPWTRAHEKFAKAWGDLDNARARAGGEPGDLGRWLMVRWGVLRIIALTPQQARAGCRQLNAWRASLERKVFEPVPYPRQWRRNRRRAEEHRRAADSTAIIVRASSADMLIDKRFSGARGLVTTESEGKFDA